MKRSYTSIVRKCCQLCVIVGICSLWTGAGARAELVLNVSSLANIAFTGNSTGTGASFAFLNNSNHEGFFVSTELGGNGSALGLDGSISGSFTYTKASIAKYVTPVGTEQYATVTTSPGSTLSISDGHGFSLTGTISGIDVSTFGTSGSVNIDSALNLTNVSYLGNNLDLKQLAMGATSSGGATVIVSFQFLGAPTLTSFTAKNSTHATSWSGSVSAAVPEPTSFSLGCIALGSLAIVVRCRKNRRSDV